MAAVEQRECVKCGPADDAVLEPTKTKQRAEIGDRRFVADLPALRCTACGTVTITSDVLRIFEMWVAGELARGLPSGAAFRWMRKAMGLSAAKVAEAFNLTTETLSRWENDHRDIDRAAWIVLGTMVLDRLAGRDTTVARLEASAAPKRTLPKEAKLELGRYVVVGDGEWEHPQQLAGVEGFWMDDSDDRREADMFAAGASEKHAKVVDLLELAK